MRIVDVLDDGFAGMKHVSVRNVMEKEEQVVGRLSWRFVELGNERRGLSGLNRAAGDGAVQSNAVVVGAVPLGPAVFFSRIEYRAAKSAKKVYVGLHSPQ